MDLKEQPARRVVEEPRRSLLPYVVGGAAAAVAAWSFIQAGIDDGPSPTVKSTYHRSATPKVRSTEVSGDIRTIFSADDYPASAQQAGQQGTVQARLTVDPRGRVTACRVVRSSDVAVLDQATCAIIRRRARFTPAHDATGRAIADTVTTPPIVWRLEG